LQVFDLPTAELLTHDPRGKTIDQTLTVDAYVCWRSADAADVAAFVNKFGRRPDEWRPDEKDGVDHFVRTVGTLERARTILGGRVSGELGAAIGQMELDDLVSAETGRVERERERLRDRLLNGPGDSRGGLKKEAMEKYGIELVDVRLRRVNHPVAVRDAIFDRIRSERAKKAAEYQSEGAKEAEKIKSDAELKVREALAHARAEEQRTRGEADAEADHVRNQAYSKDVQFYTFLKKLEEYQRILGDGKTLLLLSSHRELFDLLFGPPKPNGEAPNKPADSGKKGGQ
jgi:membrane protease subunit HflC